VVADGNIGYTWWVLGSRSKVKIKYMGNFIIPIIAFLAPIVLLVLALRYHAKKEPNEKFAWGFIFLAFLIGWGISLWVLMYNLGYWA